VAALFIAINAFLSDGFDSLSAALVNFSRLILGICLALSITQEDSNESKNYSIVDIDCCGVHVQHVCG
jgi:hypothetical protein